MNSTTEEFPENLGFRNGSCGAHSSRTIMLLEIAILFDSTTPAASKEDYSHLIIDENLLGKKTTSTRRESFRRLKELYGLDPQIQIFRYLRFFWKMDQSSRPLLALLCASARDPLLRMTASAVLSRKMGDEVTVKEIEEAIYSATGDHFKAQVRLNTARHAASSWEQAGFLSGRNRKIRQKPLNTPTSTAYALLLGYLCGVRGALLLQTFWAELLDSPEHIVHNLAQEASRRGWLTYQAVDNIVEIDFSILLKQSGDH